MSLPSRANSATGSTAKANPSLTWPEYEALLTDLERRHEAALEMLSDLEVRVGEALRNWNNSDRAVPLAREAATR